MIIKGGQSRPDTTKNTGAGFMKEAEEVDRGTDPGTDPGMDPGTDPGTDLRMDPGKDPSADPDDIQTRDLETTHRVLELQKKVFTITQGGGGGEGGGLRTRAVARRSFSRISQKVNLKATTKI